MTYKSKTIMPVENPVNAPISTITGVPGWIHENEQMTLAEYAKEVPLGGQIFQIGHECGLSTSILAMFSHKTVALHSIDIDPRARAWTLHNLRAVNLFRHNIELLITDSAKYEHEGEIDLLFIDGLHTYAGAKNDLDRFAGLVKSGGFMLLHDVANSTNALPHPLHYEVRQALDDYLKMCGEKWEFIEDVETISVYRRK